MDVDELSYNVFYLLLRNAYKRKYELALSKCWTICVPCGDSLREVSITEEFVDDHVLKPVVESNSEFTSTDQFGLHLYKKENDVIKLMNAENAYHVKVLSVEKGYNKEYQPYSIIIVDKPLQSKYLNFQNVSQHSKLELSRFVTSHKEALGFLRELGNSCPLDEIEVFTDSVQIAEDVKIEELKETIQKLICNYWAITMRKQSLDIQRDARFQKLLSVSLEIFVMNRLHDRLYGFLNDSFHGQNLEVQNKIAQLVDAGVTPGKLGADESWANVSMPSAIVEFATLDSYKGPLEKLMCMKGTLDFIVAEIKGIMADQEFKANSVSDENELKTHKLDSGDMIPLLLYVIVKCHPQKLHTDLFYVENFVWSTSPHDGLSYTLVSFKAAVALLEQISINVEIEQTSEKL